ncbi:ATP-binding protein [Roseofilum casamattae]|uniref:histidine kinase n=1 Tax=Roseofilum casamattae BLCC-M143 TaxID=3022442 RepID=A0ABT7BVL1_9CYAN|nr:ATP-binding protein [Roseofilum casamattae]MDJ1183238.1 ATP-binding protein [Roseofilum casamattae BLCC-M143]
MVVAVADFLAPVISKSGIEASELNLESTLKDLPLWQCCVDVEEPGRVVAQIFKQHSLLPGVILTDGAKLAGMISRRRFLEQLSRPYGLEVFIRREIRVLNRLANHKVGGRHTSDDRVFSGNMAIVKAAALSLERPPEKLYEPLIIECSPEKYCLLDVHQLLLAQSKIHELTTKLLRENMQAHTIQTEKLASLGQMIAGLAHEIRNPVNTIWGNVKFLKNYSEDLMSLAESYQAEIGEDPESIEDLKEEIEFDYLEEDLPELLSSMQESSERLNQLVGGMHSFSHMGENHAQQADLHKCIDSTLLILRNKLKYGINLSKNYGDIPMIECYSGQLSQVFMNLIANAIDALNDRPKVEGWQPEITIATEFVEDLEGCDRVKVTISDNGTGIPIEIQTKIFETFFTTKPIGKGTGLGLAISHQIVTEKHQGELKLRSEVGVGTTFEICLPVSLTETDSN